MLLHLIEPVLTRRVGGDTGTWLTLGFVPQARLHDALASAHPHEAAQTGTPIGPRAPVGRCNDNDNHPET